jgi:hypothetical protein
MSSTALTVVQFIGFGVIVGLLGMMIFEIRKQHFATNSRLTALLEVTSQLARIEGFEAGRASMESLRDVSSKLDNTKRGGDE